MSYKKMKKEKKKYLGQKGKPRPKKEQQSPDQRFTLGQPVWGRPASLQRTSLCPCSLQPLFPGVNELDQISKIHDVIGTPCQKTLTKFKQ